MYYKDLTPCEYFSHYGKFSDKFVSIGWIENEKNEFEKGDIGDVLSDSKSEGNAMSALKYIGDTFPNYFSYMGGHTCMMCGKFYSYRNAFIPDDELGLIYCFPESLHHYITEHNYLPPAQFIKCVEKFTKTSNRIYPNPNFWNSVKLIDKGVYEVCKKIQLEVAEDKVLYSFGTEAYDDFIQQLKETQLKK